MDQAVIPGDDFFRYANGAWLKATDIPPDRSRYGVSAVLTELTQQQTRDMLAGAAIRADVDPLNFTNFQTDHIFGVWVSQDLDDPARYAP